MTFDLRQLRILFFNRSTAHKNRWILLTQNILQLNDLAGTNARDRKRLHHDVGGILRAVEKLLQIRLQLPHFAVVHGYFAQDLRVFQLRLYHT